MKKILLSAAFAAILTSASAENQAYFFLDENEEFGQMGQVYCVSPNGEYAVIYDEEMEHSFLWRKSEPEKLEFINFMRDGKAQATEVRAINNNGTIVGSARNGNQWQPFIKKMGEEMIPLPLTEWALNLNYPCGISEDEAVIGGYLGGVCNLSDGSKMGQSRPAMWVKGSDGEYEVIAPDNDELPLPEHCGTMVRGMYSDGTYEGSYLFGTCGCGAGSYIPFVYNQGNLILWNEIEHTEVTWYFKGQPMGTEIVETIDGKRDYYFAEDDALNAGFNSCDAAGNIYGSRVEIYDLEGTDPNDESTFGLAKQRYYRGWYNVHTKEWTEELNGPTIYTGLDGKVLFTSSFRVYPDGLQSTPQSVGSFTGVDFSGYQMMGVERSSEDGKVLGACYQASDGYGIVHAYPVMITLDQPLVGIDCVMTDVEAKQVVLTYGGTIEVIGAEQVAVYDLNGVNVANGKVSNVGAGMYVVVADGVSHKVLVK